MFRLIDGAHEEQHSFNITGMSWRKEPSDLRSPLAASQTLGVSEAFNLNVTQNTVPETISIILEELMTHGWGCGESYACTEDIRSTCSHYARAKAG